MDASRFIAGRLRFNGLIATVAIAVSFLVMILAVTISSGFRHSVRDGVASVAGDIRIAAIGTDPLSGDGSVPSHLSVGEKILSVPGVRSISPAVFRAGIVKNGEVIHGVLLKGVPGRDTSSARIRDPRGSDDAETPYVHGSDASVRFPAGSGPG